MTLHTSLGAVRAHTKQVFEEIAGKWEIFFAWGIGASGEHKQGRAIDFMTYADGTVKAPGPVRLQLGHEIANYLWANRSRLGVWYVIYRQRIISVNSNSYGPAGRWNAMPDRGDPTANHMDHVHVSFLESPPAYKPPGGGGTGGAVLTTPASEKLARFPGSAWFKTEPRNALITEMGKRLVAVGCGQYKEGPGPQWSDADKASYAAWQRKLGYSGSDADGWPGQESWDKLRVQNPDYKAPTPAPPPAPKPTPKEDSVPADVVAFWTSRVIPNRNDPADEPAPTKATPAGVLSNMEATQDVDHARLARVEAKLDALLAKLEA